NVAEKFAGYDTCLFCLGVSSAGMREEDYRHITYDFTLAAATTLSRLNPSMTFVYVSGESTDSSEKGKVMWARVKGATENAVLALPFKAAFMFRPGLIRPGQGIVSRTAAYRAFYAVAVPLFPVLRWLAPNHVTTSEELARAMLYVAKRGAQNRILNTKE